MSIFSQNLFPFLFIFLFDSLIAVFAFYIFLGYIVPQPIFQESRIIDGRRTLYLSSILGSAHGLTTSLLILYFKPQSPYTSALLTCLATFIVAVAGSFLFIMQNNIIPFSRWRIKDFAQLPLLVIYLSLIVSAILFIPLFLTGFLSGNLTSLFFK
jgi:hypothetical protein